MAKVRFNLRIDPEVYKRMESASLTKPKDISFVLQKPHHSRMSDLEVVEIESATSRLQEQIEIVYLRDQIREKRKLMKKKRSFCR